MLFFCLAVIAAMDYRVLVLMLSCVAVSDLSHNLREDVTCQNPITPLFFSSYWLDDMLHKIYILPFNYFVPGKYTTQITSGLSLQSSEAQTLLCTSTASHTSPPVCVEMLLQSDL